MDDNWWEEFSDWCIKDPLTVRDVLGYLVGHYPDAVLAALRGRQVPESLVAALRGGVE